MKFRDIMKKSFFNKQSYEKIIFFHIQKTAGSAISEHIINNSPGKKFMRWGDFIQIPKENRDNFYFISGHFGFDYGKDILDKSYSFTFLRDPIKRILSYYTFCKQIIPTNESKTKIKGSDLIREMTIEEYIESEIPAIYNNVDNLQTWFMAGSFNQKTREDMTNYSVESILEMAKENLSRLNYVGFHETFSKDFYHISQDLKMPKPKTGKVVNVSINPVDINSLSPQLLKKFEPKIYLDRQLYEFAWKTLRKLN
jgi:hypothetical protein